MNTTFETAYHAMLAADVAGEDPTPHICAAGEALRETDPTGSGTPEQRNHALLAAKNPLTPRERNQALVGRRVGS